MGNKFVLPAAERPIEARNYKPCTQAAVDEYNLTLRQYNAPFERLARWDGSKVVLTDSPAVGKTYNPPRPPPWIADAQDAYFERDIATYNMQLAQFARNVDDRGVADPALGRAIIGSTDERMVRVYNSPPVPEPPPAQIVQPNAAPVRGAGAGADAGAGAEPRSIEDALNQAGETDPNRRAYITMYFSGRQYIIPLNGRNYEEFVFYSPPAAGAPYDDALRRSMILYEQIRAFHAINTGGEVFTMKFLPPIKTGSRQLEGFHAGCAATLSKGQRPLEGFSSCKAAAGQRSLEGFSSLQQQQQPVTCVDINTAQQNWYLTQIIDTQSKRDMQSTFCENAGLRYDPLQCGLRRCLQPLGDATSEAGSDVSAKYKYNESRFNAPTYPKPADNTQYQRQLGSELRLADIEEYYKMFNKYNFYWLNQEGWRDPAAAAAKPYNPPIPPWIRDPPAAAVGERAFLAAVDAFNTNARGLIARLNNYESVNLPAAFGELPAAPPYPNLLHELLTRPQDYLPPQQAANLPAPSPGQSTVEYQIPQREVATLFNEITTNPPAPPAAPAKPACNDLSGGCLLYDDEVTPFAKKALDEMRANAAKRISSAGITYAMNKPRVPDAVMGHKFRELYDNVISDVIESLPSIIQSSKCS